MSKQALHTAPYNGMFPLPHAPTQKLSIGPVLGPDLLGFRESPVASDLHPKACRDTEDPHPPNPLVNEINHPVLS